MICRRAGRCRHVDTVRTFSDYVERQRPAVGEPRAAQSIGLGANTGSNVPSDTSVGRIHVSRSRATCARSNPSLSSWAGPISAPSEQPEARPRHAIGLAFGAMRWLVILGMMVLTACAGQGTPAISADEMMAFMEQVAEIRSAAWKDALQPEQMAKDRRVCLPRVRPADATAIESLLIADPSIKVGWFMTEGEKAYYVDCITVRVQKRIDEAIDTLVQIKTAGAQGQTDAAANAALMGMMMSQSMSNAFRPPPKTTFWCSQMGTMSYCY